MFLEDFPEEKERRKFPIRTITIAAIIAISIFTVWWFKFRVTPAGTYSKYGISFDYPEGSEITEEGILENQPNADSGMVTCSWSKGAIEYLFGVGWIRALQYDIDAGFEGGFSSLEDVASNIVQGERGESTLAGHTLYYQPFECDLESKHFYCVLAVSHFMENEKAYIFMYMCEYQNPFQKLLEFLETFEAS